MHVKHIHISQIFVVNFSHLISLGCEYSFQKFRSRTDEMQKEIRTRVLLFESGNISTGLMLSLCSNRRICQNFSKPVRLQWDKGTFIWKWRYTGNKIRLVETVLDKKRIYKLLFVFLTCFTRLSKLLQVSITNFWNVGLP